MSSLTKMLAFEWARPHLNAKGKHELPLLLTCSLPPELGEVVITTRDGTQRSVRVVPQKLSRTAFFELDEDDEDAYHAGLVDWLFHLGMEKEWGGVAEITLPTSEVLDDVASYFKAYAVDVSRVFVGMIGFVALLVQGLLTLPEEVEEKEDLDMEALTVDDLSTWMEDYLHVGKVDGLPVFFNPHMTDYILFCADPKQVGQMARAKETAAIMIHNAERGTCILKVLLENDNESDEDPDSSTEESAPS